MSANNKPWFYIASVNKVSDSKHATSGCGEDKSCIELVLIKDGYVVRNSPFGLIRVNSQEVHLSVLPEPFLFSEIGNGAEGWYCCFNSSFLKSVSSHEHLQNEIDLISSFLHKYPLRLNRQVFERLYTAMGFIDQLYEKKKPDYFLIYIYLLVCIYELKKTMQDSSLDFYPSKAFYITKQYGELLSVYIAKERSIDFYTRQLNISPNHLNKSVRAVTGKTAIAMLNEARLGDAKRLLKDTDQAIADIAFQLGFEDPSYFSRFFRKLTGMTPGKYRTVDSEQ